MTIYRQFKLSRGYSLSPIWYYLSIFRMWVCCLGLWNLLMNIFYMKYISSRKLISVVLWQQLIIFKLKTYSLVILQAKYLYWLTPSPPWSTLRISCLYRRSLIAVLPVRRRNAIPNWTLLYYFVANEYYL